MRRADPPRNKAPAVLTLKRVIRAFGASLDTASFNWPNINDGVSGGVTASSAVAAAWRSLALRGCPVQEACQVDA